MASTRHWSTPAAPPGEWQTYDIFWTARASTVPSWSAQLISPWCTTGVLVHHHVEVLGPTGHRGVYRYEVHPPTGPLRLQDHGDLVRYRNIWARPVKGYDES